MLGHQLELGKGVQVGVDISYKLNSPSRDSAAEVTMETGQKRLARGPQTDTLRGVRS